MRAVVLVALAGCADPVLLGEASVNVFPEAASATVVVANVNVDPNTYRVWSIEIGSKPAGSSCQSRGDALVVFEVWTGLGSAPRGVFPIETSDPPPAVFPALYVSVANGVALDGEISIDAASSTGLVGTYRGATLIDGASVMLEAAFDAPTCAL